MSPSTKALTTRRVLATASISASALGLAFFFQDAAYNIAGYAVVPILLLSGALVWTHSLAAQVAIRGLWWATSMIGAALAVAWTPNLSGYAAAVSGVGSSLALLSLGFSATVPEGKTIFFAPRAGRATFSIALLLAASNALVLGYFGLLYAESLAVDGDLASGASTGLLLGLAVISAAGAAGLFTLRVWAWGLANITTLAIAGLAAAGVLQIPTVLAGGLIALGGVAVLTQSPLLIQLLSGRGLKPSSGRWTLVPTLVSGALFAVSASAVFDLLH